MKFTPFPAPRNKREVYMDYAAATPLEPSVLENMLPFIAHEYGNPGGLYRIARRAKSAVDAARAAMAGPLGAQPRNIFFTGSGTESINLALFGAARRYAKDSAPHGHCVTTAVEHHAVLHSAQALEKQGYDVTYLQTDEYGLVDPRNVIDALRGDTLLVSIIYGNNEVGTLNPIADIGRAILRWKQEHGRSAAQPPFFHTDACQAALYEELDVRKLHVDLLSLNGSKLYGPKGTGALYKADSVRLTPILYGGGQEMRLRAGTENVAGIAGLAAAFAMAREQASAESARLCVLQEFFIDELQKRIPKTVLNGHPRSRLPNNINVSILDIEGEALLLYLDEYGVAASTGSACTSESLDPSHVILALGRPYEYAHGSMRFTLGRETRKEDIEYVLDILPPLVGRLREISPVRLKLDRGGKPRQKVGRPQFASAFVADGKPHWMK